jgi:hypothetical protein
MNLRARFSGLDLRFLLSDYPNTTESISLTPVWQYSETCIAPIFVFEAQKNVHDQYQSLASDPNRARQFWHNCPRAPYHGARELLVERARGSHPVVPLNALPNRRGKAPKGQELGMNAENDRSWVC